MNSMIFNCILAPHYYEHCSFNPDLCKKSAVGVMEAQSVVLAVRHNHVAEGVHTQPGGVVETQGTRTRGAEFLGKCVNQDSV